MAEAPPFPSPTKRWHNTAQPSTSPTRPELSAKGKSVLITGGGSTGIGGETARYFAQAGASRIAILGRRMQPLLDNKTFIENKFPGVEVIAISADVTKKSDVDVAFAQFAGNGKINVVVSSAAAIGPKETIGEVDGEEYLGNIQDNVAGALWVAQAFIRHAAPDAVAIAINSFGAHLSLNDLFSSYCVAKWAVYRLWDTVALTHPNLSIFHTQPGVVLTELNLSVGGAASFKDVKVDDVSLPASFNVWLASPEARFLKGKFLWCNWDVDELKAQAKEIEEGTKLNIGLVGWPFGVTA
ncbi:nadp-binding rossmann-fold containing [Trichoderma arundinaceum]|uniref:Nadp-binding rossmann-fold containing n=1 Tax=Trichoderma arundinaceum TaxID=490622 RepID=A0A395NXT3_TRIAR|nr:nadp-binding rossmann-fold containing [Trichoderma arundinaceum]